MKGSFFLGCIDYHRGTKYHRRGRKRQAIFCGLILDTEAQRDIFKFGWQRGENGGWFWFTYLYLARKRIFSLNFGLARTLSVVKEQARLGDMQIQEVIQRINVLRMEKRYPEADKLRDYLRQHNLKVGYTRSGEILVEEITETRRKYECK